MSKIRIYCDVDGVINLLKNFPSDADVHDAEKLQVPFRYRYNYGPDTWKAFDLRWRTQVVEALSEFSKRDDVDFIWVTTWRWNATEQLDELWDIKSSGYLRWFSAPRDDFHLAKLDAVEGYENNEPAPFIWIDDVATVNLNNSNPFETREDYMVIATDGTVGLTDAHLTQMRTFINKYSFTQPTTEEG